jgi:hypothetical protein
MDKIDRDFATHSTGPQTHKAICAAIAVAKKTLNQYYARTDFSDAYRIAMGMHSFPVFAFVT